MRNPLFRITFLLWSLSLLLAVSIQNLRAQDVFGRISGTVTDQSGAVVSKAKVTVVNEATKIKNVTEADESGFYIFPSVRAGTYSVVVEQTGFKSMTKTGNVLVAGGRLTVDMALSVGTTFEKVTVEATGETVNVVSGEVARTVDTQQVQDLALNTRNYMQLVSLVPGVALTTDDQLGMSTNMAINNQAVNGNRADQNLVTVDGGFNMDSGSNASQINNVGLDFVQEVSMKTSNFSAEYGRNAGASINVVTRSGTNNFHGSVFEYLRNDVFDAINPAQKINLWKAPDTPIKKLKPPLRFNDFGWTFGGPISKGKLFFFVGEEWKRVRQAAAPQLLTIPTTAEMAGDFSASAPRLATHALCVPGTYIAATKTCGATIPGNNIAAMMTTDGKAIANVYERMSQIASSFTNTDIGSNATFSPNNPSNWREDIIRIDYHPNDKHVIYGRYIHDSLNLIAGFGTFSDTGTLPTVPTDRRRPGYSYQIADVWTINSHLVNEAKINASWNKQRIMPTGDTWMRSTYGFQFPFQFAGGRFPNGIPYVTFNNSGVDVPTAAPTFFDGPYFALLAPTTDIAPTDDLTWQKGRHTLRFGALFARNRKDQNSRPNSPQGKITFDTSNSKTTGDPFADALLGNFSSYAEQSADPIGHFRFHEFDVYANESWRVTGKLSLELGLRFERSTPTYTQGNNMVNFDPGLYDPAQAVTVNANDTVTGGNRLNGFVRPGQVPADQVKNVPGATSTLVQSVPATAARGFFNTEELFAPRFGFSYAPFTGGKTAVRGGFGIFYEKPEGNIIFSQPGLPPFLQSVTYTNGNLSNPAGGTPNGSFSVFGISAIDPDLVVARTMQFSLGVQQELPWSLLMEASYVGMLGRHELRQPNINNPSFATALANPTLTYHQIRPYLGYTDIRQYLGDANSNYNALQLFLTKRKGNVTAAISYTYSKALGNAASGFQDNPEPEAPYNLEFMYGPLSSDRRHIFAATYTYSLPFFRSQKGLGGAVLAGWEISGITRLQSGQPLTPNGNAVIGSGGTGRGAVNRRANYNGGPIQLDHRSPVRWFNTAAFSIAAPTALGTAGTGSILGPSWQTWDLSLRKTFGLPREGMTLGFQADAFNVLNRANWQNPNLTWGPANGSFGTISGANNPRNIQFGLRLAF